MIPYDRRAWVRLLFSRRGTLARTVGAKVLSFGVLAVIVCIIAQYTDLPIRLPVGFHEIAGVIIGLVLAFRTNTAYARFWEGRTLWGGIVNSSRNLARVVTNHADLDEEESRQVRLWIVAFDHATRCRLRGLKEVRELRDLLSADDYEQLVAARHPALFCADKLSRMIADLAARGALTPVLAGVAEEEVIALVNYLGGCERILRTPTPLGYILLMERGVFLYLGTLPAGLIGRLGWLTPVVTVAVAYLVLMIETIGTELDNPFGIEDSDIPLDRICDNISYDLLGIGRPPSLRPQKGIGTVQH